MKKQIDNKYNEINIIELINNSSYDSAKILSPLDKGADARYLNIYNKSGVSLLLDVCLSELKNAVHCCWVDYSCMATTMISKYNYGFEASALNLEYSDSNIIKNINTNLNKSISLLNSEYRNVYFHPDFLNGNHIAYISSIDAGGKDKANDDSSSFDYNKYNPEFSFCSGLTRLEQTNKDVHHQIDATRKRIETNKLSVNDFVEYMHKNYRETFLCMDERSRLSSFYICLPCIAPSHSSDSIYSSQTACFIFITVTDKHKEFVKNRLSEFSTYALLHSILSVISVNLPFVAAMNLKDINLKEAIKSAKAAIMSRNMSHNLGSHVMAYLKQKLYSVADILKEDNKVLSNILPCSDDISIVEIKDILDNKDKIQMPFLVGLGKFLGYLQERQDYIATIATDYIPYNAPVSFKDSIYDELNPDLRFERHNKDGDSTNNKPANILLDYIVKSEGFSRENDTFKNNIRLGFINYSLNKDSDTVDKSITWGDESKSISMAAMRKFNFSMPGGLVGRQAVFSIVENIIRNAAKHGKTETVSDLDFMFDIIDGNDIKKGIETSPKERICDEQLREMYRSAKDIDRLFVITITDNLKVDESKQKELLKSIRFGLIEKYVDDSGKMTTGNKGIKEMRISAAWLRHNVDEEAYKALEYVKKSDGNDSYVVRGAGEKAPLVAVEFAEGCLRYIFCIEKNMEVAIVGEGLSDGDNKTLRAFVDQRTDWRWFDTIDNFKAKGNKSFGYILVANKELYNIVRPIASNRVIVWNNSDNVINGKSEYEAVMSHIYQLYSGITENEPIYIWDNKAFEENYDTKATPIKLKDGKSVDKHIKLHPAEQDGDTAKYVYRTHHTNEKDFASYWAAKNDSATPTYRNIMCVDGISGDNSSDRLVRREDLNEKWYYMHLNAMQKRVAIFDERIFRIVHGIDDVEFIDRLNYDKLKDKLKRNINNKEYINALLKQFDVPAKDRRDYRMDPEKLLIIFEKRRSVDVFKSIKKASYKSIVYAERSVDVFSIVFSNNAGYIIGKTNNASVDYTCNFNLIAKITPSADKTIKIEFEEGMESFKQAYDYLSIHQGLLDKLYEAFGVKHSDESKLIITEAIHSNFNKDEYKIIDSEYMGDNKEKKLYRYLPNFIIHSGRAKPTADDMPQRQPFIQYAAIENGVKDCKYSLVELLDHARYEE